MFSDVKHRNLSRITSLNMFCFFYGMVKTDLIQVLQSLENGKWLPEENFELTDFSSAVQVSTTFTIWGCPV